MLNRRLLTTGFIVGLLALVFASTSIYTLDQRVNALVISLGEVRKVVEEPGLHFKWPLIEEVRTIEKRNLTLESPEPVSFLTSDKRNLVIEWFVKWRVNEPRKYWRSFRGVERNAAQRLTQVVKKAMQEEISVRTVEQVLATERDKVIDGIKHKVGPEASNEGLEVLDVRLSRVDFDASITNRQFDRMRTERLKVANEQRSTGAGESERIRADADRRRQIILAEAYRQAQQMRGEGDAQAARIYAEAFSADPEFAAFYRSMDAYRELLHDGHNVMVLDSNSQFLKYLRDGSANAAPSAPTAPAAKHSPR